MQHTKPEFPDSINAIWQWDSKLIAQKTHLLVPVTGQFPLLLNSIPGSLVLDPAIGNDEAVRLQWIIVVYLYFKLNNQHGFVLKCELRISHILCMTPPSDDPVG